MPDDWLKVRVKRDLMDLVKAKAAQRDLSQQEAVAQAIEDWLRGAPQAGAGADLTPMLREGQAVVGLAAKAIERQSAQLSEGLRDLQADVRVWGDLRLSVIEEAVRKVLREGLGK